MQPFLDETVGYKDWSRQDDKRLPGQLCDPVVADLGNVSVMLLPTSEAFFFSEMRVFEMLNSSAHVVQVS